MHLHTTLLGLVSEARPDKGGRRTDSCVSRVCVSLVLLASMSTTATAVTDVVATSTGREAQAVAKAAAGTPTATCASGHHRPDSMVAQGEHPPAHLFIDRVVTHIGVWTGRQKG